MQHPSPPVTRRLRPGLKSYSSDHRSPRQEPKSPVWSRVRGWKIIPRSCRISIQCHPPFRSLTMLWMWIGCGLHVKVRGWAGPGTRRPCPGAKLPGADAAAKQRCCRSRSLSALSACSVRLVCPVRGAGSGLAPAACQLSPGPLRYICLNECLGVRERSSSAKEGGRIEREPEREGESEESFPF